MRNNNLLSIPFLAALLLTGCNPSSDNIEVVFWHTMGQANQATLNEMIRSFNEKYPKIKISHSSQGNYDDLASKIKKAIPVGNTPTMAFCYPDNVADYIASGAIQELTPYLTDSEIGFVAEEGSHMEGTGVKYGVDDYIPGYWGEGSEYQTDGLYSVPFSKSTEALFYNATYFEQNELEVPTTWTEMLALCRQIKQISPTKIPLGYDSDSNLYITLSQQLGIPYTSKDPEAHYQFNNADAKEMVGSLKGFYDEGLFVTKGASPNNSYTSTQFTNGEVIMTIGSTGGTSYNTSGNFEVEVAVPPSIDAGQPAVISQGPSITVFKRATNEEKRAAWLFYKHITNTENSARYSILTGYEPVRVSSYESDVYQLHLNAEGENINLFTKTANTTINMRNSYFYSPVFIGSATARDEVGGIIANVLLGQKTVEAAFNDALTACVFGGQGG